MTNIYNSLINRLEDEKHDRSGGFRVGIDKAISLFQFFYNGKPAIEGKPLELQTRDELLAYIRARQQSIESVIIPDKLMMACDEAIRLLNRYQKRCGHAGVVEIAIENLTKEMQKYLCARVIKTYESVQPKVSLDECAESLFEQRKMTILFELAATWDGIGEQQRNVYINEAKAVLDAAGVDYE